jgi:hypothetical protein
VDADSIGIGALAFLNVAYIIGQLSFLHFGVDFGQRNRVLDGGLGDVVLILVVSLVAPHWTIASLGNEASDSVAN